jgi:hypothetical protein
MQDSRRYTCKCSSRCITVPVHRAVVFQPFAKLSPKVHVLSIAPPTSGFPYASPEMSHAALFSTSGCFSCRDFAPAELWKFGQPIPLYRYVLIRRFTPLHFTCPDANESWIPLRRCRWTCWMLFRSLRCRALSPTAVFLMFSSQDRSSMGTILRIKISLGRVGSSSFEALYDHRQGDHN